MLIININSIIKYYYKIRDLSSTLKWVKIKLSVLSWLMEMLYYANKDVNCLIAHLILYMVLFEFR